MQTNLARYVVAFVYNDETPTRLIDGPYSLLIANAIRDRLETVSEEKTPELLAKGNFVVINIEAE